MLLDNVLNNTNGPKPISIANIWDSEVFIQYRPYNISSMSPISPMMHRFANHDTINHRPIPIF